jgi:D-alanine-D-alanine ligase
MEGLQENRHEVVAIGITPEGRWLPLPGLPPPETKFLTAAGGEPVAAGAAARQLIGLGDADQKGNAAPERLDVVFPVLHGLHGEDGTLQGLLEMANVPYVGSGVLGSAVGMDKAMMKIVFRAAGLPVADYLVVREPEWADLRGGFADRVEKRLGWPCFVKPANSGSSVGISKVKDRQELGPAVATAFRYDRKILVERFVPGREIECSVLGNDKPIASVPGEIVPAGEFYDYRAKYIDEDSKLLIPAPLDDGQVAEIQDLSVRAFLAVECAGMARVDFMLHRESGEFVVNELNTIPGFTAISMYPKLWEASGLGHNELLDRLLELALERHARQQEKETCYSPDPEAE